MRSRCASLPLSLMLLLSMLPGLSFAATLEQLSESRLIDESTEIVRGTVVYCNQTYRQPIIWTVCELNVTERFKGSPAAKVMVYIPGGTTGGLRQSFEGSPTLTRNSEYLLFLWQGKSGIRQIMGLSQGMLKIVKDANGNLMVARAANTEDRFLTPDGKPAQDSDVNLGLNTLRNRISARTPRGARQ